jgi:hypothetical protein
MTTIDLVIQLLPLAIILALIIPAWAMILHKAGYSGWLSLIFLVPIVNLILFLWFAFFAQWPVRQVSKDA